MNKLNTNTMKNILEKIKQNIRKNIWLYVAAFAAIVVVSIVAFSCGGGGYALAFAVVAGVANSGAHVTGEPLTTDITKEASPDLLENTIDKEIVKMRPMATPIDQISRQASAKPAESFEVEYYSVDTKPTHDTVKTATTEVSAAATAPTVSLDVNNPDMWSATDTILCKGVSGYDESGINKKGDLVLYVRKKADDNKLVCQAMNGSASAGNIGGIPVIAKDTVLLRMARASTELDVQTEQFESLPKKDSNFCQIFKLQVEQSTFQKMHAKEVQWNFSDLEECAIYDMRMGMEKSFMFGAKSKIYDANKKAYVYSTGGIWYQAGKEYRYNKDTTMTQTTFTNIIQQSFTNNSGNKNKILFAGKNLIEKIDNITFDKTVFTQNSIDKWGLTFRHIVYYFGELFVMNYELMNEMGMEDYGFIFDPDYINKYTYKPFKRNILDLNRNSYTVVFSEASCLTLKYPLSHMRIIPCTLAKTY